MPARRKFDGSVLIGLVFVLPALLYLSFWENSTREFRADAKPSTAEVMEFKSIKRSSGRRGGSSTITITRLRFLDESQQYREDWVEYFSQFEIGDRVPIYYTEVFPYATQPGWEGIWRGRIIVVWIVALGAALSLLAWLHTRNQPPPPDPETASYAEILAHRGDNWDS